MSDIGPGDVMEAIDSEPGFCRMCWCWGPIFPMSCTNAAYSISSTSRSGRPRPRADGKAAPETAHFVALLIGVVRVSAASHPVPRPEAKVAHRLREPGHEPKRPF